MQCSILTGVWAHAASASTDIEMNIRQIFMRSPFLLMFMIITRWQVLAPEYQATLRPGFERNLLAAADPLARE